jgi:hypothetical protein
MSSRTTNDRAEGERTFITRGGNGDQVNFDVIDSFRHTFEELSDVEDDESGATTTTATDASDLLTITAAANNSDNTISEEATSPHNAATIFRYNRSKTMSAFSAAAALPTDDAGEVAWPFDEIVASFVPHTAEKGAQSLKNKVDNALVAVAAEAEKAVPALQIASTFASSFESSTDSNDEEIAMANKLPADGGDEETEEVDKRTCPRTVIFWIAISLLGVCFLGLIIFPIVKNHEVDNQQEALMTGSIIPGSPEPEKHDVNDEETVAPEPEKHDVDEQQLTGPISPGQPETNVPTADPSSMPTESKEPSDVPSIPPSVSSSPSSLPSRVPSGYPSTSPFKLFNYGESLYNNDELGIQLSEGLNAKLIAQRITRVKYTDGSESTLKFHEWLDGAGVAPLPDGGYVYVSNSEDDTGKAGVFGLYFDKDGGITNYKALLTGTTWNCGGGKEEQLSRRACSLAKYMYSPCLTNLGMTPWDTWISCEGKIEHSTLNLNPQPSTAIYILSLFPGHANLSTVSTLYLSTETSTGQCWQVEPNPDKPHHYTPKKTLLGGPRGGNYESVAVDNSNVLNPVFFTTEDNSKGELRRFVADGNGWDSLHEGGVTTYLEFLDGNNFQWTSSLSAGEKSASKHYPNSEGIAYHNSTLYFVSKTIKTIFMLDLTDMTYTSERTGSNFHGQGSFNAQPDQIIKSVHDHDDRKYIYFTEEGNTAPGAHARDGEGTYYTLFRAIPGGRFSGDETVGIAFSPDRKRFYCGYQEEGVLFEITREDGQMFN